MSSFLKLTVLSAVLALPLGICGARPCLAQDEADVSDGREPVEPAMDEYKVSPPLGLPEGAAEAAAAAKEQAEQQSEQAEAPAAPDSEIIDEGNPAPEPEPEPVSAKAAKKAKKGKPARAARKARMPGVTSDVKVDAAGPEDDAEAKARRIQEALTHLAYGTVPEPAPDAYATFSGTITFEGLEDIVSPRDGRLVITISSGEWVAAGDMIGFVTSPELAAIMAYTPQEQRLTAAQRWKQVYGAEVIKAPKRSLVVQIYRRDKSIVKKGDLLFSLADEAYLVGSSKGDPNEVFSPGMRAEMRLRGVAGSPVIPGILQESYQGEAARSSDPLADELKESSVNRPYSLRIQIPGRAAALVKPGSIYDGYITMRNNPTGPVIPARSLVNRNGRTYLITMSEVSVMGQTNDTVQLDVAPWPGTTYIFPETIAGYSMKRQPQSAAKNIKPVPGKTAKPAAVAAPASAPASAASAATLTEAEVVSVNVDEAAPAQKTKKAAPKAKAAKAKAASKKKTARNAKALKAMKTAKSAKAKQDAANSAAQKSTVPPDDFSGGLEPMPSLPPATTGAARAK